MSVLFSSDSIPSYQRTLAAFVLAVISNDYPEGQKACFNADLIKLCFSQLDDSDSALRRWLLLCLAKVWDSFPEAKWAATQLGCQEKLNQFIHDPCPEVRAAAVYALGTFFGPGLHNFGNDEAVQQRNDFELKLALPLLPVVEDINPWVRKCLVQTLAKRIHGFESQFSEIAQRVFIEERNESQREKREKIRLQQEQSLYLVGELLGGIPSSGIKKKEKKKSGNAYSPLSNSPTPPESHRPSLSPSDEITTKKSSKPRRERNSSHHELIWLKKEKNFQIYLLKLFLKKKINRQMVTTLSIDPDKTISQLSQMIVNVFTSTLFVSPSNFQENDYSTLSSPTLPKNISISMDNIPSLSHFNEHSLNHSPEDDSTGTFRIFFSFLF